MRILVVSRSFSPSIGGSETNAEILAHQFSSFGHDVCVVTETTLAEHGEPDQRFLFSVIRQPSPFRLAQLVKWCDVCIHNGISLRAAWPLLLVRRPWIIRHQVWLRDVMSGTASAIGGTDSSYHVKLKYRIAQAATSISVSKAIAARLPFPSTVIPNPYREDLFHQVSNVPRTKDIVFLGRLVSEKGAGLLLRALSSIKCNALHPSLTIIGSGPEEVTLRQQAADLSIGDQVTFAGTKSGQALVNMLNEHKIMVIPSLYHEPFGVVALEGIACGCVVVGSNGGGLPEAIGPCGETFPNGDVAELTTVLVRLLLSQEQLAIYRSHAPVHLAQHRPADVAERYLAVIQDAVEKAQK